MLDLSLLKSDPVQDVIKNGRRYDYRDDVWVQIRPIYGKVVSAIAAKCEKIVRGKKVTDEALQEKLLRAHVIAAWGGLVADGQPIPPTAENVDLAFENLPSFASWVLEKALALGQEIEDMIEARKENFTDTSVAS